MQVLTAVWLLMLFDPLWLVASWGAAPILRLNTVAFGLLLVVVVMGMQTRRAWQRRWSWFAPMIVFILTGVPSYLVAVNTGFARNGLKVLFFWWLLIVATVAMIGSVKRAEQLLQLYGLQFLWWVAWGGTSALVTWHHSLNNNDAFGAFMVGGVSISFFLGMGAPRTGRFRRLMFLSAFLCMMGVVASYARGAFLATVAVYCLMWLRSPRKLFTLGVGVGMVLVVVVAAMTLFPPDFFYNEIMSAFAEGTSEGTGQDRAVLWGVAIDTWNEHPIFGVGLNNVGAYASYNYQPGDLEGMYGLNPGFLYGRSLHNIYFTVLAEQGTIGMVALLWLFIDFWRRNALLRQPIAQAVWHRLGGTMELKPIALGLEMGMVAFMLTAIFYPMMTIHWFFTMLAVNTLLHRIVSTNLGAAGPGPVRARGVAPAPRGTGIASGRARAPGFARRA